VVADAKNPVDKLLFSFLFPILVAGGFSGNQVELDTCDPNKKIHSVTDIIYRRIMFFQVAFTKYRLERTCYG